MVDGLFDFISSVFSGPNADPVTFGGAGETVPSDAGNWQGSYPSSSEGMYNPATNNDIYYLSDGTPVDKGTGQHLSPNEIRHR
jgi:hypothetical protein